jgi:hypothetical protein
VSLVQSRSVGNATSLAYNSAVTSGNRLICAVAVWNGSLPDVNGVSDDVNGAWTFVRGEVPDGNTLVEIWVLNSTGAGTPTVSLDIDDPPGSAVGLVIAEESNTTGSVDANNATTGSGTTPSVSLTTVASSTVAYCAFSHGAFTTPALSSGSGWSEVGEIEGDWHVHFERKEFNSAGSQTCDGTIGSSVNWAIVAASWARTVELGRNYFLNRVG